MILLLRTLNINIKLYCLLDSLASIEKYIICHNPKQLVKKIIAKLIIGKLNLDQLYRSVKFQNRQKINNLISHFENRQKLTI